jgi:hypothetical protein
MKRKKKHNTKQEQLKSLNDAIQQQSRDMANDNRIEHHRDNETNRKFNGLPNRRLKRNKL